MSNLNQQLIPSVNFHLWEPCNFKCKFCFATFQDVRKTVLPKGHLPKEQSLRVIDLLAEAGLKKITFAGGEPSLCPWITDLIIRAKAKGFTTMMVTNGSQLSNSFLNMVKGHLDWIVISIDSINPEDNVAIGRHQGKHVLPDSHFYLEKINLVKDYGFRIKVNTVVNRVNYQDNSLAKFMKTIEPLRWKIFQALRVVGQNDKHFQQMEVTESEFQSYIELNSISQIPFAVIEDNKAMTGTYLMVDPAGRFFDNTKGCYTYSQPILEVGVLKALNEITYSFTDFINRAGLYEWD